MSKSDVSVEHESAEFAALALESLQEGVRRALIDHERRGFLVPSLCQAQIEWVLPSEKLSLYPAAKQRLGETQDAEQGASADN